MGFCVRRRGEGVFWTIAVLPVCVLVFPAWLDSASEVGAAAPQPIKISQQLSPPPQLDTLTISSPAEPPPTGTSIICLGDSLTQGVGASVQHDYPSLLSQRLGTPVINAGVDGDETIDALKRLDTDVFANDPRLVVVELGANDFLDGVPLEQTFANLDTIVQRIEAHGARVVLVGMAPGLLGEALQPDYDQIIRKYHTAFVPKVLDDVITNPGLLSADHLHPNDRGYALIAERIRRVMEPLLTQPRHPS